MKGSSMHWYYWVSDRQQLSLLGRTSLVQRLLGCVVENPLPHLLCSRREVLKQAKAFEEVGTRMRCCPFYGTGD